MGLPRLVYMLLLIDIDIIIIFVTDKRAPLGASHWGGVPAGFILCFLSSICWILICYPTLVILPATLKLLPSEAERFHNSRYYQKRAPLGASSWGGVPEGLYLDISNLVFLLLDTLFSHWNSASLTLILLEAERFHNSRYYQKRAPLGASSWGGVPEGLYLDISNLVFLLLDTLFSHWNSASLTLILLEAERFHNSRYYQKRAPLGASSWGGVPEGLYQQWKFNNNKNPHIGRTKSFIMCI